MRRLGVFTGPGRVEVREIPATTVVAGELLVEPVYCGICAFERSIFAGSIPMYPCAPGHEVVARVKEICPTDTPTSSTDEIRAGDLVLVDLLSRCGTCVACTHAQSAVCVQDQARLGRDGTLWVGGGFADELAVDVARAYVVTGVDPRVAALGEPLACVYNSVRRGALADNDRVLVIGAGLMGRLHQAVATYEGCRKIGVVDTDPGRLEQALAAGATWVGLPDEVAVRSADVIFNTVANDLTMATALRAADVGGRIVLFGVTSETPEPFTIDPLAIHRQQVSIIGCYSQEPSDWDCAVRALQSAQLVGSVASLVSAVFPLEELPTALEVATSGDAFKVLVSPVAESWPTSD